MFTWNQRAHNAVQLVYKLLTGVCVILCQHFRANHFLQVATESGQRGGGRGLVLTQDFVLEKDRWSMVDSRVK